MKVVDRRYRFTSIIPANKFPDEKFYGLYFEELRKLDWLELDT